MQNTRLAILAAIGILAPSTFAQAPETWAFDDGNGFSAEATFRLIDASTLEVALLNTSESIPAQFGGSDIILTGLSWDFAGASAILGGMAKTGSSSASVGFTIDVGSDADISGEWGYGNGGATGMHPNMISGNQSHMTPFGGANLVGPDNLAGPSGGVISAEGAPRLGGQGAVQDEIIVTLALTQAVPNLGFLSNGVRFEYGSDYVFGDGHPVCDTFASITSIMDANGYNADALYSTNLPVLGALSEICFDDAADTCGIAPGSMAFFYYSQNANSIPVPFGGCNGGPSEILIDVASLYGFVGPLVWTGPGQPACFQVPIPLAVDKCGATFFAQGGFLGANGVTLTNAIEIVLGQ